MKNLCIFFFLIICSFSAYATLNGPCTPGSAGAGFSGSTSFCIGATASPISYNYAECSVDTGSPTGVACTATWYCNTTSTTAITGATITVAADIAFTTAAGSNGDLPSFTPATAAAGTYYYFCVVSWSVAGMCSPSFTTAAIPVTISPAVITISGTASVCTGSSATLTASAAGGAWSSSNSAIAAAGSTGVVTAAASGMATITYSVTNACGTLYATKQVTVSPAAYAGAISGAGSVNTGSAIALLSAAAGGTWSSSNSNATVTTAGVVTGIAAGSATISYSATNGCGTATATKAISITAATGSINGPQALCQGATITLSNSTAGGTWSSRSPFVATVSTAGVVTGITAGTSVISYVAGGITSTTTVTVNPPPALITGASSVCLNAVTLLANATDGGTWGSSNSTVADVAGGLVSGIAAGTASVTYMLPTGCFKAATLTVKPLPVTIAGAATVCAGLTTTLTDASSGGMSWSSSTPAAATITNGGVLTGVAPGTTTVTFTLTTGCYTTVMETVLALPASITGAGAVCVAGSSTLASATTGGTWASSNSATATIGSATGISTGIAAGTAIITYTAAGCRTTKAITINATPAAISGYASTCPGYFTTLASAPAGGTWSSANTGIATVGSTGIVTGIAADTTAITYTLGTGCRRTAIVTVSPAPVISGSTSVCYASAVTFTSSITGGAWSSSNLATASAGAATGIITGLGAGTANIMYSLNAGCKISTAVTVSNLPAVVAGATPICAGGTTTYTDATGTGTWSSSNAAVAGIDAATGVITGLAGGTANITFTTPAGCYRTKAVNVGSAIPAPSGAATVCIGYTTTLDPPFYGQSWTSSNTAVASVGAISGVISGLTAGTAIMTFTPYSNSAYAGCISTTQITVNPNPAAIAGAAPVCMASSITLSSATPSGTWSSSNSLVAAVGSATGAVTGISPGNATITYRLPTGCYATATITINPLAAITGVAAVCEGSFTYLANAVTGGTWSSSNNAAATIDSATGTVTALSAGGTGITYTTPAGCTGSVQVTVNVAPSAISGTPNVCAEGNTTLLGNTLGGGKWIMSDTTIATVDSTTGTVTSIVAGTSVVTYITTSGCKATAILTVNALPGAIAGNVPVCAGAAAIALSDTTAGGSWSTADSSIAAINATTGNINGLLSSTTLVSYTLPSGCFRTVSFLVNPLPAAITGTPAVCSGAAATLASATTGGSWSVADTALAGINTATGILSGIAAGNTSATYTLPTGCFATAAVTINPLPAAITGATAVCAQSAIMLANATAGGAWSSGNTAIATAGTAGTVTGVAPGNTMITYTLPTGCIATSPITVNLTPATITGSAAMCLGLITSYSDATPGGTWSTGNSLVAAINPSTGQMTSVAAGTTTVSYTLTDGCYTIAVVTVNILPPVTLGVPAACVGSSTLLTTTSTGGGWSSSNTAIATVGTTGLVTGVANGIATITYSNTYGCSAATQVTIGVIAGTITGPASVVVGSYITLSDAVAGGLWSSSNVFRATVLGGVVTGISAGAATISYSVTNLCGTAVATKSITISTSRPESGSDNASVTGGSVLDAHIWPNPCNGTFNISGTTGSDGDAVYADMTNMAGQLIYSDNLKTAGAKIAAVITLNDTISDGSYILSIRSGNERQVYCIVLNRR